jgi:hypothetical protein
LAAHLTELLHKMEALGDVTALDLVLRVAVPGRPDHERDSRCYSRCYSLLVGRFSHDCGVTRFFLVRGMSDETQGLLCGPTEEFHDGGGIFGCQYLTQDCRI